MRYLSSQVVLPDRHRADNDTVIFLPTEHAADDAETAEQRGAVATLQQVQHAGLFRRTEERWSPVVRLADDLNSTHA